MDDGFRLGMRVRALRQERGLSQRQLAGLAGLSPNAISLIERDEISPSVATLQRLATALNVRMTWFFEGPAEAAVIHARAGVRPYIAGRGVTIEGLGARLAGQQMEPFWVTLAPDADSGQGQVSHAGHELVCCVEGSVEYHVDGERHLLRAGDILYFEAQRPHYWRNGGDSTAVMLLVLQATGAPDAPARAHFAGYPSVAHMG